MKIKRVVKAASWAAVATIASVTTLGVLGLALLLPEPLGAQLAVSFGSMFWLTALAVALVPWWALAAVVVQAERKQRR